MRSRTRLLVTAALALLLATYASVAARPTAASAAGGTPQSLSRHLYDPLAEQQWFYGQRMTSGMSAAQYSEAYLSAVSQAAGLKSVTPHLASAAPNPSSRWTSLGPSPVTGDLWSGSGDVSGRIDGIALASGAIYLATAGGGVWSSADNGQSWQPLGDSQPSLAIGAVAVAPSDPQVIYAGTGEAHQSIDSFYGVGVLKSTDGGTTWSVVGGNIFSGQHIAKIVVDPGSDQTVYVASTAGLYETTDGGSSWTELLPGSYSTYGVTDLVMDPVSPSVLYAAVPYDGIEKSTDGGATWTLLAGGLPSSDDTFGNTSLAIDPGNPEVLYASIASASPLALGSMTGVFKTTDGGASWTNLNAPDVFSQVFFYGGTTGSYQGWYDNTIAVDPANPQEIVAGGIGLTESLDGGATWSSDIAGPLGIHPDQHALAFDAAGDLYIGNDGGVWEIPSGASAATDLNAGLTITQMYPGLSFTGNAATIVDGSQDNGTEEYSGAAAWSELQSGDGGMSAIDPQNPQDIWVTSDQDISFTDDGGTTWNEAFGPPFQNAAWVPPLALDPANPGTLYFGGSNVWVTGAAETISGQPMWTNLTQLPTTPDQVVSAITIAPSDPGVIYAGWSDGLVMVSSDGGSSWSDISNGLPARWVTSIEVSPRNPYDAWVTLSGYAMPQSTPSTPHVFQTTNANAIAPAWTDVTGNLPDAPVNALVLNGSELIAGTDVGVFASTDGGTSWTALGSDLPNVQVMDLKLTPSGTLLAATHGRGVWMLSVGTPASAPTAVTGISPTSGPPAGGTAVTITGSGFSAATSVSFGGIPAESFTVVSDSEIEAVAPPGGGLVDVEVTAESLSAATSADKFTYLGTPIALSLTPRTTPDTETLSINGSGFGSVAGSVYFQESAVGTCAQSASAWSGTGIETPIPTALLPGTVEVSVYNATTGYESNSLALQLTAGPALTSVTQILPYTGGTVTLQGAGFGPSDVGAAVYFDTPTNVVVFNYVPSWSDMSVNLDVPSLAIGPTEITYGEVSVAVYSDALGLSNDLPLTVDGPPDSLQWSQASTSVSAGSQVTLSGSVTDSAGDPLAGVTVDLSTPTGTLSSPTATTDAGGAFTATLTAPDYQDTFSVTAAVAGTSVSSGETVSVTAPQIGGGGSGGGGGGGGSGGSGSSGGTTSGGGGSSSGAPTSPTSSSTTGLSQEVDTSQSAVTVATGDDAFTLTLPKGSLPKAVTLTVTSSGSAPAAAPLPSSLELASRVWTIDTGGIEPTRPVTVTFHYTLPGGVSPLQLGVYTLVRGAWQFYTAGQLDATANTITATLGHLSTWAVLANLTTFKDVPPAYWAFQDISELTARGIASGFAGGTFRPDRSVTRAEFIKMLLTAIGIPPQTSATQPFRDVSPSSWYAGYLDEAYKEGLVSGTNGRALPNATITREEAAVMVVRAMKLAHLGAVGTLPAHPARFSDRSAIGTWALSSVQEVVTDGIMGGFPDGSFQPTGQVTRAQAAAMIIRLLGLPDLGTGNPA